MITLRQLRSVVAVFEEGSFTRAAARENATQSGVSQHVAAVEKVLAVPLFARTPEGVTPTPAGQRYYTHAIEVLRHLEKGASAARATQGGISGTVRAGLMPAFTRAALAPVLDSMLKRHPDVAIQVIEGYSGTLTDMVRAEALDFALVPSGPVGAGISMRHLATDREMLVSAAHSDLPHGASVRLRDLGLLDVIVPTPGNVRRRKLDEYFETHGARIGRVMEMDAMMGTLELVARSNWVTVLPGVICFSDVDGVSRRVARIDDPPLMMDFVVIEPARRPLSPAARLFLDAMQAQVKELVAA